MSSTRLRMVCDICESEATSLHFGALSCKACAAFFRRTVSLNLQYDCINGKEACEIHHDRRMSCKRCRYEKCLKFGMQRDLVKSRKGRADDVEETTRSPDFELGSMEPSTSKMTTGEYELILKHLLKLDSNLNKNRKMIFTDASLSNVFGGLCTMPYKIQDVQEFDVVSYAGYAKYEYVMMFNYINNFKNVNKLPPSDQNFFFRTTCGVDYILATAYYTSLIGMKENKIITHDGRCVNMSPLPLSDEDTVRMEHFRKSGHFEKYKNLIESRVILWKDLLPIFSTLKFTFEEYALTKQIACWKLTMFNFTSTGREISMQQQLILFNVLLRYGTEDGAARAGSFVLFLSLIEEHLCELFKSLIVLIFFDILPDNKMLAEVSNFGNIIAQLVKFLENLIVLAFFDIMSDDKLLAEIINFDTPYGDA